MISALFSTEVTALESQVAALQTQIAQAQQRISHLNEAEFVAGDAIKALTEAVHKVAELAPDAIANLKTAVLNLFTSDDGANDDGNQPINPAPEPAPPEGESVDVTPAPEPETEPVESPSPAWELVPISDTVAYFKSPDGEIGCTYAGFNNKSTAKRWGEWLALNHSVATGFEVREAKRLTNFKHELKLWGMSPKQIQRLSECDLRKSPPSNYGDAPKRPSQPAPPARPLIEVGDIVSSTVVPHWRYEVVEVEGDGKLQCRRLDDPTVVVAQSEWSVTLISKSPKDEVAHPTIDVNDVPQGIVLHSANDDILVEYIVFAWVIVRNQGKPEPQQKQIGRLVEGLGKIEAYKPLSGSCQTFGRTLDAVNHLLNSSDYRMCDVLAAVELRQSHSESQPAPTTVDADCGIEECKATERDLAVTAQPESQSFQIGNQVEVFSNRHGDDLVGQVGKVTIANPVGCVVVVGGQTRWFCVDEIALVEASLPTREAKPMVSAAVADPS